MRLTKHTLLIVLNLSTWIALLLGAYNVQHVHASATPKPAVRLSGGEKCFQPTGVMCMHALFLGYWQSHGGLSQFGYPITDELTEDNRIVQYTERARFEWHPEFRDTPNEVLLSLLGTQLVSGRNEAAFRKVSVPA